MLKIFYNFENPNEQKENLERKKTENPENTLQRFLVESIEEYTESDTDALQNIKNLEKYLNKDDAVTAEIKTDLELKIRQKIANNKEDTIGEEAIKDKMENADNDIKQKAMLVIAEYNFLKKNVAKKRDLWFEDFSDADKKKFDALTETLSPDELKSALKNQKSMQTLYKEKGLDESIFSEKEKLEELQKTIDNAIDLEKDLTEEQAKKFIEEFENCRENREVSKEFISIILGALDPNDSEYSKKLGNILKVFIPTIACKEIISKLPKKEKENITKNAYKQFIDSMTDSLGEDVIAEHFKEPNLYNTPEFENWFLPYMTNADWPLDMKVLVEKDFSTLEKVFFADAGAKEKLAEIITLALAEEEKKKEKEQNELDSFVSFKDYLKKSKIVQDNLNKLKKNEVESGFDAINNIEEGNYITLTQTDGDKGIFYIDAVSSASVSLTKLYPSADGNWKRGDNFVFPYSEFAKNIENNLESDTTKSLMISKESPDAPNIDSLLEMNTLGDFIERLDMLDEKGKEKGFEPGTTFAVNVKGHGIEFATLVDTDELDQSITVRLFTGEVHTFPWEHFLDKIETENMNFRRLGKVNTLEDFINNAAFLEDRGDKKELEKLGGLVFDDNQPCIHNSEENKNIPIWGFKNEDKGVFVKVKFEIGGPKVKVTQYKTAKELGEEIKLKSKTEADRNREKKAKEQEKRKIEINYGHVDYVRLLQIMQIFDAKTPAVTEEMPKQKEEKKDGLLSKVPFFGNKDQEPKTVKKTPLDAYEEENYYLQGEYMGDLNTAKGAKKSKSLMDVYYMIKNGYHYINQRLEHKREVDSAYAFINMKGHLGIAGREAMSSIIDAEMKHIKDRHSGVDRREYIRKYILDNPKARPHQIIAGVMLTLEMSGTLYPDTKLSDLQGTRYLWFEKMCFALGVDAKQEFKRCRTKVIGGLEKNANPYPPEEEMIERLLKFNQPNKMVQAIGGGAKLWKMAESGKKDQIAKGVDEVKKEGDKPEKRVKYILGKFESNEFEISLGALPELIGVGGGTKNEYLGVMFAFTAGGAPNYVHYNTLKQFNDIVYTGVPFHGLAFCGSKKSSDLYQDVVDIVLRNRAKQGLPGAQEMLDKYKAIKRPNDPRAHNGDTYAELYDFWNQYHGTLHSILQGVDPTLQTLYLNKNVKNDEKAKIKEYLELMHGDTKEYFLEEGGVGKYSDHNGYKKTFIPSESMMYMGSREGIEYRSLAPQLASLGVDQISGVMSSPDREKVLNEQILGFLRFLRDNETFNYPENKEYQKKQYIISYLEIRSKILEKVPNDFTKEIYETNVKKGRLKHFLLLEQHGFDISYESVVLAQKGNEQQWQKDAEAAYERFMSKKISPIKAEIINTKVQDKFNATLSGNDEDFKQAA